MVYGLWFAVYCWWFLNSDIAYEFYT